MSSAPAVAVPTLPQRLFARAAELATGVLTVRADGSVSRIELERGYVHGLANVGDRRGDPEAALRGLLDRLADHAGLDAPVVAFQPRAASSRVDGFRVAPFHPARVVRAHLEARGLPPLALEGAVLRLRFPVHASAVARDEQAVLALLQTPRRFEALAPFLVRTRLLAFLQFLAAVGALDAEDAEVAAAYALLGLPSGAPLDAVKRAYRVLASEVHPDRHPEASPDAREALEARFRAVNDAYRRLVPAAADDAAR